MLVALRYIFCRKEGNLQLSDVLFIDDIEIMISMLHKIENNQTNTS